MTERTQEDLKTLREEMAQLRADLGKIGDTLQNIVRHGSKEAVGSATQTAEKLREEVTNKTRRLAHEIEQRPLTAALTAFGLGLILGMLLKLRRSRVARSLA